jgi:lipoate-protein ligase A
MARTTWDLIVDPPLDGETNMAVDAGLLSEVDGSDSPLTVLRFYTWNRPTVSLGRNQIPERAVDMEFCRLQGLGVVRRPTGGRAVLHDDELTYAIVSSDPAQFAGGSIYGTYRRISEALALGFRKLGVNSTLSPQTHRRNPGTSSDYDDPCFVSPSRYELMVRGRKIVGSAQRRLRRGFLQHGSMPISCDRTLLARVTRFEDPNVLDSEMSGIAECLDKCPDIDEMTAVFVRSFEEYFEVDLRPRKSTR